MEPGRKYPPIRLCLIGALAAGIGCQTPPPPLPITNLSEPGWTVRQGQAVWRPPGADHDFAGDLIVATRAPGSSHPSDAAAADSFVQFTKTPFSLVVGRTTSDRWEIDFPSGQRRVAGRGGPPARFLWLHLGSIFEQDCAPPAPWRMSTDGENRWRFENRRTGEALQGYLTP